VQKGEVRLGFTEEKSHTVIDIHTCPVLEPALMEVLPALLRQIASMKKPSLISAVHLTALDAGLDMILQPRTPLSNTDKTAWRQWAEMRHIVRLAEQTEVHPPHILHDTEQACVMFADVSVALPVGAFLQASHAGEAALVEKILQGLHGCTHVADLYAGCGTYSFPLARNGMRVAAFEGSQEMIAAAHNAALAHGLDTYLSATVRDLFTHPLHASELVSYDSIVINPPRNGALPQVQEIAKSAVPTVVYVSCNPATFARDAGHLLAHGYRMTHITGIDQFTWSRHLELVAVFARMQTAMPA
jgi:23S rRNA (uracil1939-C5)-methyltransferase